MGELRISTLPSLFAVSAALLGPDDGSCERLSDSSVGGCLSQVGEVLPIYSLCMGSQHT